MAQATLWNPYGPGSDIQGDPDFQDRERYQDFPPHGPAVPVSSDYDLDAFYQRTLGRAPDANERTSDLENISKYGASAFESDFLSKRPSNQPGTGSYAQQATSPYSTAQSGSGDAALSQFMQYLQSQQSQQAQQQAALREILMGQLKGATEPVSENSPGIREVLAGGRLGLQRGAERERRNAAEMRAYDGSGGLGGKAFDSDVRGILEHQGEADAQMTGQVLNQELQSKRDQIQRLLTLAMQLGDAESARTLQAQLNSIQTQLAQSNQYDDLAYRYSALNSNNNLQALLALLNAA